MNESGFLEPERIVQSFGLRPGDHAADFGAGHGYFTIALSRAVGREGKVYAVDIQKPALDIIRSKAKIEHILNIEYVQSDLDESGASGMEERFLDFVFMGNVLFQAERKDVLFREAWRVLREKGRLAIIEWDVLLPMLPAVQPYGTAGTGDMRSTPDATSAAGRALALGPPPHMRIKKEAARALAIQAGFELDLEFSTGPHHYGLLFKKP